MTETIAVPTWLALLAGALALWAALDHFVLPLASRLVRLRAGRAIDELNTRLQVEIAAFQRTKRRVIVNLVAYGPKVAAAISRLSVESGVPAESLMRKVERIALEIVPSFRVSAYFRLGSFIARRAAQSLYRVRLAYSDHGRLADVESDASVVFVMNHRSNFDYIVVTYMAIQKFALSYAVGEWANIWPLNVLVRSLGAFFVRRNSGDPLYRQVLAQYVQLATDAGVVQAVFPEGGLTMDGRLRQPKLGLINYMVSDFDPEGQRDLVFIPVGINYDRVLEDRYLIQGLDAKARPRSPVAAFGSVLRWFLQHAILIARRRRFRNGYACVNFGVPISMRSYLRKQGKAFREMESSERFQAIEQLGRELIAAIGAAIPVVPVALVATVFVRNAEQPLGEDDLRKGVHALMRDLEDRGAYVHIPRADPDYAVTTGLRMLTLRRIVTGADGQFSINDHEKKLLEYYANSICHFINGPRRPADTDTKRSN